MNNLNIKFKGGKLKDLFVEVDGKSINFKKNNFGSLESNCQTENKSVNIKIFRCLEIQSKFWFLWQMLFFFISIFGIFDRRLDRKSVVLDSEFNIDVSDNTTIEFVLDYTSKENVLKYKTDANITEVKNISYIDAEAKKKKKILLLTKIFSTIGIAILVALLIILI